MSGEYKHYQGDGEDTYNKNTEIQKKIVNSLGPLALNAVASQTFTTDVYTIVDYGCAQGANSLPLINSVVGKVKEKWGGEQQILVIYEDLPHNDFKTLFSRILGKVPGDNPKSLFYNNYSGIFISGNPVSFYKQIVPKNTVHFGLATCAFHWMPESPCKLENSMFYFLDSTQDEQVTWSTVSAQYWDTIFSMRAEELAPGGHIAISIVGLKDKKAWEGFSHLMDLMNTIYRDMINVNVITQEEFKDTNICVYMRTEEEIKAPFRPGSRAYDGGLRLLDILWSVTPCPLNDEWIQSGDKDGSPAAMKYAQRFTKMWRIVVNHAVEAGISSNRPSEERAKLVEEIFERFSANVAENPSKCRMDLQSTLLDVTKCN